MKEQTENISTEVQAEKAAAGNLSLVKSPDAADAIIYIEQIDFSKQIHDLVTHYRWLHVEAHDVCRLYRNYLFLLVKYPEKVLPPSKAISQFWRHHILDTCKYANDSQAVFGCYLHHSPYLPVDHLNDSLSVTKQIYLKEFGERLLSKRYRLRHLLKRIKIKILMIDH